MWKNVKWGPTFNSTEITLQARGMDLIDCLSFLFQLSFSTLGKVSIYLNSSRKSMNKYRYNSCSSMSWCICFIYTYISYVWLTGLLNRVYEWRSTKIFTTFERIWTCISKEGQCLSRILTHFLFLSHLSWYLKAVCCPLLFLFLLL